MATVRTSFFCKHGMFIKGRKVPDDAPAVVEFPSMFDGVDDKKKKPVRAKR
jgi:hypothetical protein